MTLDESADLLLPVTHWPFIPILTRLGLSAAMGIFIGLEREHSQKTGVRTFSMVALMGCLGGLMGNLFAGIALFFVAMIIVGMNYKEIVRNEKLVLTTSAAIAIVGFAGVLFGQGHVFTPTVAGVITAALLAWKRPISQFALGLSDQELRSAILLAVLTFVILPVLPTQPVDPWGLIEPRSNWASVIIIAGIGFINYILMKWMGVRGMEVTAFFGGLINSRKVIVELGTRLRDVGELLLPPVRSGILLATAAMILRNLIVVAALAHRAVVYCLLPMALMLLVNAYFWWRATAQPPAAGTPPLTLESPFKLSAALKFGAVFLLLNVVGAMAQRTFGAASFYFVSIAGGLLSSASSIASAATLIAHHELPVATGVNGIVLSSLTSILANIPLIRGFVKEPAAKRNLCLLLCVIAAVGLAGGILNRFFLAPALPNARAGE